MSDQLASQSGIHLGAGEIEFFTSASWWGDVIDRFDLEQFSAFGPGPDEIGIMYGIHRFYTGEEFL